MLLRFRSQKTQKPKTKKTNQNKPFCPPGACVRVCRPFAAAPRALPLWTHETAAQPHLAREQRAVQRRAGDRPREPRPPRGSDVVHRERFGLRQGSFIMSPRPTLVRLTHPTAVKGDWFQLVKKRGRIIESGFKRAFQAPDDLRRRLH